MEQLAKHMNELDLSDHNTENQSITVNDVNFDELYIKILNEVLQNSDLDLLRDNVLIYLQAALNISCEKHRKLKQLVQSAMTNQRFLNVEIVETQVTPFKKTYESIYIVMYLNSNRGLRVTSPIKNFTMDVLLWEEIYSISCYTTSQNDSLCIELWAIKTDTAAANGIFHVAKKLVVPMTDKESKLIGSATIDLHPSHSIKYSLNKKGNSSPKGYVKVRITNTSSSESTKKGFYEYYALLRRLLRYELNTSKVAPNWWAGVYSTEAQIILEQHIAYSRLIEKEVWLIQWIVYCEVHTMHALNINYMANVLNNIYESFTKNNTKFTSEQYNIFWEGTEYLLPSIYEAVIKLPMVNSSDKHAMKYYIDMFDILSKIKSIKESDSNQEKGTSDKFHNWLDNINEPLIIGVCKWFNTLEAGLLNVNQKEQVVKEVSSILERVYSSLKDAVNYIDPIVLSLSGFTYSEVLYTALQDNIVKMLKCYIEPISRYLDNPLYMEQLKLEESEISLCAKFLFEVYLQVHQFLRFKYKINNSHEITNFYIYFKDAVPAWIQLAHNKALHKISKAVEMDSLKPDLPNNKHSKVAEKIHTVFCQTKQFWEQLDWPNVDDKATYLMTINRNFYHLCEICCEQMLKRIENTEIEVKHVEDWCLVESNMLKNIVIVNNMDYIKNEYLNMIHCLLPTEQLKAESLNHVETIELKITTILINIADVITLSIRNTLYFEVHQPNREFIHSVMQYIDKSLQIASEKLSDSAFEILISNLWTNINIVVKDIVDSASNVKKSSLFYKCLYEFVSILQTSYNLSYDTIDATFESTKHVLYFESMNNAELMYHIYTTSTKIENCHISARLRITSKKSLEIEILNAYFENNNFNSAVSVQLLPLDNYVGPNKIKKKTKIIQNSNAALYEELFEFNLSQELEYLPHNMVYMYAKDYRFFHARYIGGCLVNFDSIPSTDNVMDTLDVMNLQLYRLNSQEPESEAIKILNRRKDDIFVKQFLRTCLDK